MKKTSTEEFIEKARKVHENLYDYSKVQYVGATTKVLIIDPVYGEFWQLPNNHLTGSGNPIRGDINRRMNKLISTSEFIKRARKVHGKLYDYSKVQYVGATTKVLIIDPVYGEFWQYANNHLRGSGHPARSSVERVSKLKLTTSEFIKRARKVHGDLYDYSKVQYINARTKVLIIDPVYGEFWQRPTHHLQGSGSNVRPGSGPQSSTAEFINKARKVHGNKYDYSKVKYENSYTKVLIIDPVYGEFWQLPSQHLKGKGCPCKTIK